MVSLMGSPLLLLGFSVGGVARGWCVASGSVMWFLVGAEVPLGSPCRVRARLLLLLLLLLLLSGSPVVVVAPIACSRLGLRDGFLVGVGVSLAWRLGRCGVCSWFPLWLLFWRLSTMLQFFILQLQQQQPQEQQLRTLPPIKIVVTNVRIPKKLLQYVSLDISLLYHVCCSSSHSNSSC